MKYKEKRKRCLAAAIGLWMAVYQMLGTTAAFAYTGSLPVSSGTQHEAMAEPSAAQEPAETAAVTENNVSDITEAASSGTASHEDTAQETETSDIGKQPEASEAVTPEVPESTTVESVRETEALHSQNMKETEESETALQEEAAGKDNGGSDEEEEERKEEPDSLIGLMQEEKPVATPSNMPKDDAMAVFERTLTAETESYIVEVSGTLPDAAVLAVDELNENDSARYLENAPAAEGYEKPSVARFFDIRILLENGEEYTPESPVTVRIDLKDVSFGEPGGGGAVLQVLHYEEEHSGDEAEDADTAVSGHVGIEEPNDLTDIFRQTEVMLFGTAADRGLAMPSSEENTDTLSPTVIDEHTIDEDGSLSFETESFSVYGVMVYYTVDFYYYGPAPEFRYQWKLLPEDETDPEKREWGIVEPHPFDKEVTEHHIEGGSSIALSDLLSVLEVDRDISEVTEVTFTDETLVSLEESGTELVLNSLKPFTSIETLTLQYADGEYGEIFVTDAIAGPSSFGTNLEWEITDGGELIIRPKTAGTTGVLPSLTNVYSNPSGKENLIRAAWPWYDKRNSVKSIRIEDGVTCGTSAELRYMFYNMDSLTSVDVSGLDATNVNVMNDMFRDCDKLVDFAFCPKNPASNLQQVGRMFESCDKLKTVDLTGLKSTRGIHTTTDMFKNCPVLESANIDGLYITCSNMFKGITTLKDVSADNVKITGSTTFDGCTGLTRLTISGSELGENPFNGCTGIIYLALPGTVVPDLKTENLIELDLSGAILKAANAMTVFHVSTDDSTVTTPALKKVTMNGMNVSSTSFQKLFLRLTNLKEVDFTGINIENIENLTSCNSLFEACSSLTNVEFGDFRPAYTTTISHMFNNCSSLESIDISGFGKIETLTSANNVFSGCTNLKTLNISGLDTSNLNASSNDLGTANLSNLETIIATGSNVCFIKGADASDSSGSVFPSGTWKAMLDGETQAEELNSSQLATLIAGSNVISAGGKTMSNSTPGILPAGVYIKTTADSQDEEGTAGFTDIPETFYILNNVKGAQYEIDIDFSKYVVYQNKNGEIFQESTPVTNASQLIPGSTLEIYTKRQDQGEWGKSQDYVYSDTEAGDEPIVITFKKAVTDVNGKVHDLTLTVSHVEFKDSNLIQTGDNDMWMNGKRYYPNRYGYSHHVMTLKPGRLSFQNYIVNQNMEVGATGTATCRTGGVANTYIDFAFDVKDAEPGSSILYFLNDIDVDSRYKFRPGAEGIILRGGADLESVRLSENTKLRKWIEDPSATYDAGDPTTANGWRMVTDENDPDWNNANYIVGSEGDSETALSRFYVKADATGSAYTWTSGNGCTTNIIEPSSAAGTFKNIADLNIIPNALKTVDWREPAEMYNGAFEFLLKFMSVDELMSVDEDLSMSLDEDIVDLQNVLKHEWRRTNAGGSIIYKSFALKAPGTDSTNNYRTPTYIYKINETDSDPLGIGWGLDRDQTERYMKIELHNPETDEEMSHGLYALITLGEKQPSDTEITWEDSSRTVWSDSVSFEYDDTIIRDGVTYDVKQDVYGNDYYIGADNKYYDPNNNIELTPGYGTFFPSSTDGKGGAHRTINVGGVQYVICIDPNGLHYYVKDGKFYALDGTELSRGVPSGEQVIVNGYGLYRDKHGTVYYYDTSAGKYYSQDGTEIEPASGTFVAHADDPAVKVQRYVASGGNSYPVNVEVHGVFYYKMGDKYYDPETNAVISPANGVFDPHPDSDKVAVVTRVIDDEGSRTVKMSRHQIAYYEKDGHYYNADDRTILIEKTGTFEPDTGDAMVTVQKVKTEAVTEAITGSNYPVYRDANGIKYYTDGTKYYAMNGDILAVGTDVAPSGDDRPIIRSYAVFTDTDGVEYYGKAGRYYRYSDDSEHVLPEGMVDASANVDLGSFNNSTKKETLRIRKETVDGAAGTFNFEIKFYGQFEVTDYKHSGESSVTKGESSYSVTRVTEPKTYGAVSGSEDAADGMTYGWTSNAMEHYRIVETGSGAGLSRKFYINGVEQRVHSIVFDPAHMEGTVSLSDGRVYVLFPESIRELSNTWAFTLEDGQELEIYNVPQGLSYEIYENLENDPGWRCVYMDSEGGDYISSIVVENGEDNSHVIRNEYDEPDLTIRKTVAGNMGSRAKEFDFTLYVENRDGTPYTGLTAPAGAVGFDDRQRSSGIYAFRLAHGDSISFSSLPADVKYRVQEADDVTYRVTHKVGINAAEEGRDTGLQVLWVDTDVLFTNTKNTTIPTGRNTNTMAMWLLAAIGLAGTAGLTAAGWKRRKTHV